VQQSKDDYSRGAPLGAGSVADHAEQASAGRLQILYGVVAFLGFVARADGRFHPRERDLIHTIADELAHQGNLDFKDWRESDRHRIIEGAMDDKRLPRLLFDAARSQPEFRRALLIYAWRVAARDGSVSSPEIAWISRVAIEMGGSMEEVQFAGLPYIRTEQSESNRAQAAAELGVHAGASADEIKRAYRDASKTYHPDRHPGASDAEKKRLSEIFARVTQAYNTLQEGRQGPELVYLHPETDRLETALDQEVVRCFNCGKKVQLPPPEHHLTARCPKCQALLLFSREKAAVLARARW
ncbi:DnaJ domain-containing protein, partial [bacterium]|nr:DnaJ domain-containing protein [bacterium]